MALPSPTDHHLDLVIAEIGSGKTLSEAARVVRFSPDVISKHLKVRRNFHANKIKRPAHNRKQFDRNEAILAYEGGESPNSISKRLGISRPTLIKGLKEAGVNIRGQSEAGRIVWANLTPEDRLKQVEAAHDACRGRIAGLSEKLKRARSGKFDKGLFEEELHDILVSKGREVVSQAPVSIYAIDLLVGGRVAVELGTAHANRYRTEDGLRRIEKIIESGLSFFYIQIKSLEAVRAHIDNVISDIDMLCGLPSGASEKRVVRCATYNFTRFRNDLGQIAAVRTPPKHHYIVMDPDWL